MRMKHLVSSPRRTQKTKTNPQPSFFLITQNPPTLFTFSEKHEDLDNNTQAQGYQNKVNTGGLIISLHIWAAEEVGGEDEDCILRTSWRKLHLYSFFVD